MLDDIGAGRPRAPVISPPGSGQAVMAFGDGPLRVVVPAGEVGRGYGVWEMNAHTGFSPPRHLHHREDEIFHVLAGELLLWCNGETWRAGPGTTAALPRGVPHSFLVTSPTPARVLMTVVPGGFETFFAVVSGLRLPGDEAALIDISNAYGIEYVGPPLQL